MNEKYYTRKEIILGFFSKGSKLTCAKVCSILLTQGYVHETAKHYLSGNVSTILLQLVKAGKLQYDEKEVGPKGGHVYKIKR